MAEPMSRYSVAMSDLSNERAIVLVYSQRPEVRAAVRSAVGRRPSAQSPRIEWVEATNDREVTLQLDTGEIDVVILDGEAQPTGGMGLARQFKYEIANCPPIGVIVARKQDAWLANWSLADAVISTPLDPVDAATVVAGLLEVRMTGAPVIR
jgi:DNA-binding NarL/FixJ family response regulator